MENTLRPFWLSSDLRGPLGPDNADVLFFDKDQRNVKVPAQARDYFLGDDTIKKAYDSVEQYPEWTPHLTLGYPEKPAKPDTHDTLRYASVHFDRIAVWFGDSEGVEYRLKETRSDLAEVGEWSMSDELEDLLEHHGVKGMKWGVRKDKGHEGERATNKKIAKLDQKFEKGSNQKYWAVYNKMADGMNGPNGEFARINSDPRFKGKNLIDPKTPLARTYHKEIEKAATKLLNDASDNLLGTNASGTKKWDWDYSLEGLPTARIVDVDNKKVKHADGGSAEVKLTWDKTGHVTSVAIPKGDLEQTDVVGDWFEHFGVKGMRWGVRRSEPTNVEVTARPGAKVATKGGANQTPHEDAIKVAVSKQKAKASTTDSLSTKELQELVNRMNLEQQYSTLTSKQKTKSLAEGQKQIKTVLGVAKTYNEVSNFLNTDAGKMLKTGLLGVAKTKLKR